MMKTVLGSVVSSKAVSLSKAARILSKFSSSDNGASPAFAAYLKRASASFDELVQLHKVFKGLGSEHKGKKHLSSGIVNEETANSVKKTNEDGLLTEEKQGTSEWKKHKGGKTGEREAKELESSLKIDDEKQRQKKRRDEGEGSVGMKMEVQNSEGIVDWDAAPLRDGKKSKKKNRESNEANVEKNHNVGVKSETESQNKDRNKKKRKNKDKNEKNHNVGPVKTENEEQVCPSDQNDSNRKMSEIEKQNLHEETKKKKRDKGEKGKIDGIVKIEKEEQGYPPGQNGEATEFVENDGSEQKKHIKRKKKIKEKEIYGIEDAEQINQSDGGDENVHEVMTVSNHVKVESGEGKKHKKKQHHESKERVSGGMVDVKEANEKESRKRKHEGDGHEELEDTEEQHRAKKKKKTGVGY